VRDSLHLVGMHGDLRLRIGMAAKPGLGEGGFALWGG
jgi:hypothetical protein